ncbi:MAG: hypothetical protein AB7L91_13990 [Dehalococcoidia bacterium]
MLDALPPLRADLIGHADSLGAQPERGSPGALELRAASDAEAAALQFGRLYAYQCLVAGGHGLIALARGLEPPTPEYGTWSIARTILDSSSLACWLLDGNISRRERARRAFAVQLADLEAESCFLTALLAHRPGEEETAGFSEVLVGARSRRQEVLSAGAELGEASGVPSPVDRAGLLGAEFEYVMCTSILEGRPWALLHATAIQSGYDLDRVRSILTTQVQLSARWYAQAVWAYVSWMSRESLPELQSSLEFGYDSLALPDDADSRFWRRPKSLRERALAAS